MNTLQHLVRRSFMTSFGGLKGSCSIPASIFGRTSCFSNNVLQSNVNCRTICYTGKLLAENTSNNGEGFQVPKHRLTNIDKFFVVATGMAPKDSVPDEASHDFMEKVHSRRRIMVNVLVMGITGIFAYAIIKSGKVNRKEKIQSKRNE